MEVATDRIAHGKSWERIFRIVTMLFQTAHVCINAMEWFGFMVAGTETSDRHIEQVIRVLAGAD